ncbi:TPR superfamily protein, putative [Medicago truncatula]|uniref:TPR superfamily protein, putative n=1 Tax=Medicago truncatula TaxID=3880 RepID=A0A072TZL4_MEDTR|nr:TPR superfamily protein, putative [Medicago truncatula]
MATKTNVVSSSSSNTNNSAALSVKRSDILALAIGGCLEVLAQKNRKSEEEKLKNFAEALWKNLKMYLDDFLENTEANICPVIDARICRIL